MDPLAYLDVRADETINPPIPISMREMPKVSVLANFLGKIRKSTARIDKHVTIIIDPETNYKTIVNTVLKFNIIRLIMY